MAVVPLQGGVGLTPDSSEAQSGVVVSPDLSAVALALGPPEQPPEITAQAQQVREQRAGGGTVCGTGEIQGKTQSRINGSGRCGVKNPVRIKSIGGMRLSSPSAMECATAETLLRWVKQGARPTLADQGAGRAALRVIGHISCRTQNG